MSIRPRILWLCVGAGILTTALLGLLMTLVLIPTFDRLDEERHQAALAGIHSSAEAEVHHLRTKVLDYSQWDEAYQWLQKRTGDFPERKFTLVQLAGIHQISFFGVDGQLAGGVASDASLTTAIPQTITPDLIETVVKPILAGGPVEVAPRLIAGRPALVGAAPVLRSNATGPAAGCLVVIDWIDEGWRQRVAEAVQLDVRLQSHGDGPSTSSGTRVLDHQTTDLWATGIDPAGHPVYTLTAQMPRTLHRVGLTVVLFLVGGAAGIIAVIGLLFTGFLHTRVLQPLARLRARVASEASHLHLNPLDDEIQQMDTVVTQSMGLLQTELEERRRTEEQLREAIRQRSELTRLVVHDLRSPLQSVVMGIDLAQRHAGKPSQQNYLTIVADGAQTLVRLTNELLEIERLEAGKFALQRESFAVTDLIAGARSIVGGQLTTRQVQVDVPEEHLRFEGDLRLLERALVNVLSNAVKFSPPGSTITISAERSEAHMRLRVMDQGPGIAPEDLPHLFEKFSRLAARHDHRTSTGLGLSQVRLAVEAHGGQARAESTVGQGTTIILELPAPRA